MSEVLGTDAGAISVAALFNNCIDCFEHVQISRQFGDEFSRYQLRLDVAKCRLSRWGAAIDVNHDPRFFGKASRDPTTALARGLLEEMVARFKATHRASLLYETMSKGIDKGICREADLDTVSQRLHNRFRALTIQRQNGVALTKKPHWAVYDKQKMGRMIDDISDLINDLEHVVPATPRITGRLVQMEIEAVHDQQELRMIQDVAKNSDPVLEDTTRYKLQEIAGKNTAGRITGKGMVNIGHTFVKDPFIQSNGFRDKTVNHVDEINGAETSRVNIGNLYGVKGFWDK